MKPKKSLISAWKEALSEVDPEVLLSEAVRQRPVGERAAYLFWGKAAYRSWEVVSGLKSEPVPSLVIMPHGSVSGRPSGVGRTHWVEAEHPIPGPGSFAAGRALLEFFDSLRREQRRDLRVFLSGGASSLAWVRPSRISEAQLQEQLEELYRKPLPIAELNRRRSKLCALKGGGAARWLRRLAPDVSARVELISDVAPYGPEVVGSGPFWDKRVPHHVMADNGRYVEAFARALGSGAKVLGAWQLGSWESWVSRFEREIESEIQAGDSRSPSSQRVFILGGEPQVRVPAWVSRNARGGRMCQIGAALTLRWARPLREGRLEILAASSDGVDGRSGSAGVYLGLEQGRTLDRKPGLLRELDQATGSFDAARVLDQIGALIPARVSGTNVQDLVAVRIKAPSSSS